MIGDNALQMYIYYSKITMKSWFQYRIDAILKSLAVFLRESTGIIVIYLTLQKFGNINGWNVNELLFLFSLLFVTYGILIIFFTGLRDFSKLIRDGSFDRFMLRPRGLLFQVIAENSDWFAALGHGGLGITLFLFSAGGIGINWNLINVVYYVTAIIGGVLIQGAVFLFLASLNFYLIKADNIRNVYYWNMRKFAGYPISIFHKGIQCLLIYIMPFAFVNYFPSQYLLRKADMASYPEVYMYLTPFIGMGMYGVAYLFWRVSVRAYKSTGN